MRFGTVLGPILLSLGLLAFGSAPSLPALDDPVGAWAGDPEVGDHDRLAPPAGPTREDPDPDPREPITGAERADWERPSSHREILAFLQEVRGLSDHVRIGDLGPTVEGRPNPVVYLGDPPVTDPARARESGRPTVLVLASVHGNERSGAEGALQLIRELALGEGSDVLAAVNVIVVPNANPDGGEAHRRTNAEGYDLNRDWILARTPEIGAVLDRLVEPFRPEVFVDVHNGGAYPYHLNFQTTLDPAADPNLVALARGPLFRYVSDWLETRDMKAHWYAGPAYDRDTDTWFWRTTEPWPRKQHSYGGLRDMLTLLYEVPRVHSEAVGAEAVRESLAALLSFVAGNGLAVHDAVAQARRRTVADPPAEVPLDLEPRAREESTSFLIVRDEAGRSVEPREVEGEDRTLYVPTESRPAPAWGYALAPGAEEAVELLRRHGFEVETLREGVPVVGETYRLDRLGRSSTRYQNRRMTEVDVASVSEEVVLPEGSHLARLRQPGGRLLPRLLEPDAVDSLVRWNVFDDHLFPAEGGTPDVPVVRLNAPPGGAAAIVRP